MPKTRVIQNLRLDKIAAVDRPCQEGAVAAIIKREFTQDQRDAAAESGAAMSDGSFPIKNVKDLDKRHIITRARALGATDKLPDDWNVKKENIMSIEKKEHDDAIAALKVEHDTELAKLKDQLAESVAKASMSDGEKTAMEEMDADQKKKFMAMSSADRKKLMGKRIADDEILEVGGATIRKSKVGEDVFAVVKFQQEQINLGTADVKKAREEAETAKLEKRADDEFGNLPGTTVEKALVLKALAKEPEAVRKTFDVMMKAAQANVADAFKAIGSSGSKLEVAKGQQPFLAKVSEIEKVEKVSRLVALRKAQESFPDEFEAYQTAGRELTPVH